jgi:hypothetical protein
MKTSRLEKLTTAALLLKNVKGVPDKSALYVMHMIGDLWLSKNESLAKRQSEFLQRPDNWFEWSETDMVLAGERAVLDRLLFLICIGPSEDRNLLQNISVAKAELTEKLLCNYDAPTSSSMAHNAMKIYARQAQSNMLKFLNSWTEQLSKGKEVNAQ